VEGHDIRQDMASVYSLMGVCPQHDLLWPQLTAAEHLRFYGRIKGLKASVEMGKRDKNRDAQVIRKRAQGSGPNSRGYQLEPSHRGELWAASCCHRSPCAALGSEPEERYA